MNLEWIGVNDETPPLDKQMLIFGYIDAFGKKDYRAQLARYIEFNKGCFVWDCEIGFYPTKVTHYFDYQDLLGVPSEFEIDIASRRILNNMIASCIVEKESGE
jgi:hypothetical protein